MDKAEDSPGRQAIVAMENIEKAIFKKPVGFPKRRSKQKVLDEETYVEEIGKIIQRDFFPDLEKLKAQCEYLDAMGRNDISKLRELYAKYSGKKPPIERVPSPATFETPANIHGTPGTPRPLEPEPAEQASEKKEGPRLSLDQYLNAHTSQDNESFEEVLQASAAKHREKYSYLFNEEDNSAEEKQKQLALPSIETQCALPEKKFTVDTWGYKNRNYIMYVPDGEPLTREQEIEINKKRQEISYANTRLSLNPFNEQQSKETINELAKTQAKVLDGKIGVDGKELLPTESPSIAGFSFVRTPSPRPGEMDSPLMTWGEIEGTPFRLDGSDTPLPRSQGPAFKMAETPRREQLALALAEKAGEKNRDQKRKAMDVARRRFATPSPRPNTPSLVRLATLSPAARKLATSTLGISASPKSLYLPSGSLKTLQVPYSPSGIITPLPSRATPKTPRRVSTPKLDLGIKRPDNNLTDDLLNISLPKRCKAADFF